MDAAHYFSAEPASPDERQRVRVRLAGRQVEVETSRGVFSPDRVDLGTSVLLARVPQPPQHGHLLDLGCGWGPVALSMALLAPSATVWAVDVNRRALDLTRRNAAELGLSGVRAVEPDAVPDDVRLAALWSNPPIRVGKVELHAMLRHWLPRLHPGGQAWLVVQRHLGADSLHRWLATELGSAFGTERAGSAKGFRVLRTTRRAEADRPGQV